MSDYKKNPLKEWKKYVNKTKRETLTEIYSAMPIGRDRGRRFDMSGAIKGKKTSLSGVDRSDLISKRTEYFPSDAPPSDTKPGPQSMPCPEGQVASGIKDDGSPICTDEVSPKPSPSPSPSPDDKKKKYSKGCPDRDPAVGRELMQKMKEAAADEGKSSFYQLPMNHPARANYRAWYQCEELPHPADDSDADGGGGAGAELWEAILARDGETVVWYKESTGEGQCECPDELSEEQCAAGEAELEGTKPGPDAPDASPCKELDDEEPDEEPEEPQCDDREVLLDALALYKAMKGMGTDEDAIYAVLRKYGTSCARELYEAYDQILERANEDPDDGDLFDWLIDDGERAAARLLRKAIMMQSKSPAAGAAAGPGDGGDLTSRMMTNMQESRIRVKTRKSNKKRRR